MGQTIRKNVKRRAKKFLLWLAGVIVLLAALVILSPYWLGVVLPSILARAHIQYISYERIGYGSFKLHDVTYSLNGTTIHVSEVEGLTPLLWIWNKIRHTQ